MAFISKVGNLLKQSVSKHINSESSASNPSIFQAIRCMSSSKLFIGGLSYGTDDTSLREAFSSYGEVIEARVIMDRETGRSRGFGFVSFTSGEEASSAIQAMDGQLEPAAIAMVPNILPIGPLLTNNQLGNLWAEDSTCLSWLDRQVVGSVIYVAFGSTAIVNELQLDELALGLELLGQPFLWVVRSSLTGAPSATYPYGFHDRVAQFGKIVAWAPQQKVLDHPSIACFISHCGWNSTMDGVSMGIPFICWPYFGDQFLNKSYIIDVWRVGLGLDPDENGIISKEEIRRKVNQLLEDRVIRENALKLKEMAMNSTGNGGSSWKNLEKIVEAIKG